MKILITGGTGFTGSHLVKHVMREGHAAVVLDNQEGIRPDAALGNAGGHSNGKGGRQMKTSNKTIPLRIREQIVACVKAGASKYATAKKFGVSHPTVRNFVKADAAGKLAPAVKQLIFRVPFDRKAFEDAISKEPTISMAKLTRLFGVSSDTIKRWVGIIGIVPPWHTAEKIRAANAEKIRAMVEKHPDITQRDLVIRLGILPAYVSNHLKKLGLKLERARQLPYRVKLGIEEISKIMEENPNIGVRKIAKICGVASSAITLRLRRNGIKYFTRPAYKPVKIDKDEMERFLAENPRTTLRALAKRYGVSVDTISDRLRKYGIKKEKCLGKHIDIEELVWMMENHREMSREDMARHFGVHSRTMWVHLRKHGIEWIPRLKAEKPCHGIRKKKHRGKYLDGHLLARHARKK